MKRLLLGVAAAAFALAPIAALADTITLGNYSHHTVRYQIRCKDGNDSWHTFTLKDRQQTITASNDWNYDCDDDHYQIRVGTTDNDNDETKWSVTNAEIGDQFLIGLNKNDQFLVMNTKYVVGIINATSRKLSFSWSCTQGSTFNSSNTVAAQDFTWFKDQNCKAYRVSISVKHDDGSTTSQSRTIYPNNVYGVKWDDDRQVYDFVKASDLER